jgi:serine/threonine protein kinase
MLPSFVQPTSIGQRYTVIQRLGGGAMGAVFLAMDEQRHERVAIKVPAASRHWRAEYERRVLKEIGILSALQHPNIIAIQDWGQDPQLGPYIVMEYIEGGSVLQLMGRYPGNRLNPYEALRIAATVAGALAYAHSRQPPIIHRDIKPDNILRRHSDGQIKVTDFGLAAVLTTRRAMTQWGTPDYIAPEQALGKGADGRSDMYSLAATLYHMLTGLRPPSLGIPFPARPSAVMIPGVLDGVQARRIDFLIITLMAYDPNNRRPAPDRRAWRATEVAEELRAIAERRPAQVYPGPEDSTIFPSLMTSMIPPAGVAPRQPAQPASPRPQPIQPPAPHAPPLPVQSPLPPAPAQRPLQTEQVVIVQPPLPPPQAPPPPPAFAPPAPGPSGPLPAPAAPAFAPPAPAAGWQAAPPPPAIQVRPAPARPDQPPQGSPRVALSSAEKEMIAGVLVGAAGAAVLFLVDLQPHSGLAETFFIGLLFGLILWGIGLLACITSPRGRKGHFPWLALLMTILTIAIGFPLAQAVREGQGLLENLTLFLSLLIASPFLFLGALGAWLAIKLIGKDEQ